MVAQCEEVCPGETPPLSKVHVQKCGFNARVETRSSFCAHVLVRVAVHDPIKFLVIEHHSLDFKKDLNFLPGQKVHLGGQMRPGGQVRTQKMACRRGGGSPPLSRATLLHSSCANILCGVYTTLAAWRSWSRRPLSRARGLAQIPEKTDFFFFCWLWLDQSNF